MTGGRCVEPVTAWKQPEWREAEKLPGKCQDLVEFKEKNLNTSSSAVMEKKGAPQSGHSRITPAYEDVVCFWRTITRPQWLLCGTECARSWESYTGWRHEDRAEELDFVTMS